MATEYQLMIAARLPVEQVAERAFPSVEMRSVGPSSPLGADLRDEYGFGVTIHAGQNGYLEAESDDGMWEWDPEDYVMVTFHVREESMTGPPLIAMLAAVGRVLETGSEDLSLDLNGSWLILTRIDGVVARHKVAEWWDVHGLS